MSGGPCAGLLAFLVFALGAMAPAHAGQETVAEAGEAAAFTEWETAWRKYGDGNPRTAAGQQEMARFDRQIWAVFSPKDAPETHLQQGVAVTARWAADNPASPVAHVLHARALFIYALYFRGGGQVPSALPATLENFRKYALLSARYLAEHRTVAAKDTSWHVDMLILAKYLGWPAAQTRAIADEGLALNPGDDRLYFNMLWYLLWHGNVDQVDAFINDAAQARGMALYASLYGSAAVVRFKHRLFSNSLAEWTKMKQGLEATRTRYPGSANTNAFAYFACLAGDKETTRTLLAEVGATPELGEWEPNGAQTFAGCRSWAAPP